MFTVFKSNLYRITRRKIYYIVLPAIILFALLFPTYSHALHFVTVSIALLLGTVIISLLVGMDFSHGLIRNKLFAGKSRLQIYLGNYFTSCVIGAVFWLAYQLPRGIVLAITSSELYSVGDMFLALLLGIVVISSICAMVNMVIHISNNQIISIVAPIVILILAVMPVMIYLSIVISWDELLLDTNISGILAIPTGHILLLATGYKMNLWVILLVSLVYLATFNGIGFYLFRKTDLN